MDHYKIIQWAWDELPDYTKRKFNRAGTYNRLKIQRIGDPSGNAVVYALNNGDWVAKINPLDTEARKLFSDNMDLITNVLRKDMETINNNRDMAHIAVYDTKITRNNVAVTFEKAMRGESLQSLVEKGKVPAAADLCRILNKVKRTLEFLYEKHRFNHNDLHYGNLFITPELEPVIFDFDWSTLNTKATYNNIEILRRIIDTYIGMKRYDGIYDYTANSIKTSCQERNQSIGHGDAWYLIQNAYSLMMNHSNYDWDAKCKMTDMVMLVNYIIVKLCKMNKEKQLQNVSLQSYFDIFRGNFGEKLSLGSGEYFHCEG